MLYLKLQFLLIVLCRIGKRLNNFLLHSLLLDIYLKIDEIVNSMLESF